MKTINIFFQNIYVSMEQRKDNLNTSFSFFIWQTCNLIGINNLQSVTGNNCNHLNMTATSSINNISEAPNLFLKHFKIDPSYNHGQYHCIFTSLLSVGVSNGMPHSPWKKADITIWHENWHSSRMSPVSLSLPARHWLANEEDNRWDKI